MNLLDKKVSKFWIIVAAIACMIGIGFLIHEILETESIRSDAKKDAKELHLRAIKERSAIPIR